MAFVPGDVVCLRSGSQPLTVAAVRGDSVDCMWLGEEGVLFRETIPSVALLKVDNVDEDDAPDDESENVHEHEEDAEERLGRRKTA